MFKVTQCDGGAKGIKAYLQQPKGGFTETVPHKCVAEEKVLNQSAVPFINSAVVLVADCCPCG